MRSFLTIFFLSAALCSYSQYFSTGQDPASIKWKQIKTEKYRIIFPENYSYQSQYLANILDLVVKSDTHTLTSRVPRIPFLLHTRSSLSNGITVWAPKRIELYPNPPQNIYAEEWLEQLAIHEYRHAVQTAKMNQGFTRVLYYIFGEQITGAVLGLYIPVWFLEGDATATETALSNAGRGRTAAFENILRAQLLEKGLYTYDRATLGSYKNFTPNSYELGYPLVAQVRKKYGPQVWNTALDRSAKLPFMVVPFSSGIKKETGLTKVKLYRESLNDLKKSWEKQAQELKYSEISNLTKRDPKNYSDYFHPVAINDSVIISGKSSNNDLTRIIRLILKTGKQKILITPGYMSDGSLSVSGNLIAWAEWQPDERWQNKSYSVIRLLNFESGHDWFLTHRTRYFSPEIAPQTDKLAAIRTDDRNNCYIDILEIPSGNVIRSFPLRAGDFAATLSWNDAGKDVVFVLLNEKGKNIAQLNTETGKTDILLQAGFMEISHPSYYRDRYILYSGDYSGISNFYLLERNTGKIFMITSSKFGSIDPSFGEDDSKMTFADYTSDGHMISETILDSTEWIPLENVRDNSIKLYEDLAKQEKFNVQNSSVNRKLFRILKEGYTGEDSVIATKYEEKKYSKWLTLFNPHSWAPASIDANNLTVKPGVSIMSQNVLSTAFTTIGYEYDLNEETGKVYADFSFQGLYPVFDFRFDYGGRKSRYYNQNTKEYVNFSYRETNLKANARVPLNLSRGRILRFLQPSIGTTYISISPAPSTPSGFQSHHLQSLDYRLYFSEQFISNALDMYPRLGQVIDINFRNTPFGGDNSSVFAIEGNLYFPGFFRHNGFWLYAAYQQKELGTESYYEFSDMISYPWGYSGEENNTLYSFFLNYKFPLFYPDLSVGSVIYLKRLKMNLFMDYAEGKNGTQKSFYRSVGADLTADLHLLRFIYPFDLGLRAIFLPDRSAWEFQFLYSVDI